jgi:superfamily I DNA/RNA helicase
MQNEIYKLNGPLLVLAGPGTGKTEQLAKRIKRLAEERDVKTENITAIISEKGITRQLTEEKIRQMLGQKL